MPLDRLLVAAPRRACGPRPSRPAGVLPKSGPRFRPARSRRVVPSTRYAPIASSDRSPSGGLEGLAPVDNPAAIIAGLIALAAGAAAGFFGCRVLAKSTLAGSAALAE